MLCYVWYKPWYSGTKYSKRFIQGHTFTGTYWILDTLRYCGTNGAHFKPLGQTGKKLEDTEVMRRTLGQTETHSDLLGPMKYLINFWIHWDKLDKLDRLESIRQTLKLLATMGHTGTHCYQWHTILHSETNLDIFRHPLKSGIHKDELGPMRYTLTLWDRLRHIWTCWDTVGYVKTHWTTLIYIETCEDTLDYIGSKKPMLWHPMGHAGTIWNTLLPMKYT